MNPRNRSKTPRSGMVAVLALVATLALVASACGSDNSSDQSEGPNGTSGTPDETVADPVQGGKLVVGLAASTDGWVPASNRWTPSGLNIARAVYDPLAVYDTDGGVVPYLAKAFEPNDDFTEWTITLREGVTFHDGTPLDAAAVAANLEAVKVNALLGPTLQVMKSATAVDPLTVKVEMTHTWTTFPVLMAQQVGFIAHPGMLTGEITDPVGSGPFVFEEWVPDDHFTVRANPDYWRAGLPYLDEVEFRIIVDDRSRESALLAGDIDLMHTSAAAQSIPLMESTRDGFYAVWSDGADDEQLILLNSQAGALAEAEVRRALYLAIDRDELNDALFDGAVTVADSSYGEGSLWHSDPGWADPDPDEAARLVAEWEAANGPLTVRLLAITRTEDLEIAQYLQERWTAAGADVEIDSIDEATFALRLVTGDYETATLSLFNAPDPDGDYHFLDPDNVNAPGEFGLALTRYKSDTLAENLDAGRSTIDLEERQTAYAAVYAEIAENVPMIWLYHAPWVFEMRDAIEGIETFSIPDSDASPLLVNWGAIFLTEAWVS